jgi:hypothetical protein
VGSSADLVRVADAQAADAECWQRAEWHLLGVAFADRLVGLGLAPADGAGAALIAAALFLAEHTEEWGGDARDVLGELTQLGRSLITD